MLVHPWRDGVGICRTFSSGDYRHLPDQLSAFAGPFLKVNALGMACKSRKTP
jgi:hypothetical protein